MKDKQISTKQQLSGVPILSPVLHVFCMPIIVYLRRDFGFSYLRPKSVFAAISWAFILFSVYAWNEPSVRAQHAVTCLFGLLAIFLYLAHLGLAFLNQIAGDAKHDNDLGTPWVHSLFVRLFTSNTKLSVLFFEPALVFFSALALRVIPGSAPLREYLFWGAFALFLKEALNRWIQLRKVKVHGDIVEDAGEQIPKVAQRKRQVSDPHERHATTRKPATKRKRVVSKPDSAE